MDIIKVHQLAMNYSFNAKQARERGKEDEAIDAYVKAAQLESELADYYMDKPDLEPTRSTIIRSAAFLNLKAGNIAASEKYIFWGLVNATDSAIKNQLYEALELCMAFRNLEPEAISGNVDYLYKLRQKSILYVIEPKSRQYSSAVTLEMISDFSANYTKSLKAYSKAKFRRTLVNKRRAIDQIEDQANEFQKLINPVLTSAGFGSFKFSVATDILSRVGESKEMTSLKSNIVLAYHDEIFSRSFTKTEIENFRSHYSKEELDEIFRPIFNMRASKTEYRIEYYDRETLTKNVILGIGGRERKELLPIKQINSKDIGFLEHVIAHTRETDMGAARKIILKQELTSYAFYYPTNYLDSKLFQPIPLNKEITINVSFNNQIGFLLSLDELPIETVSSIFSEGLTAFYDLMVKFIKELVSKKEKNDQEEQYFKFMEKLIPNIKSLSNNEELD
jgi:hypothetical protein